MTPIKNAAELKPGDLVDLEHDPYADDGHHLEFESEYQLVLDVERETPDCVRVDFEGLSCGFPPGHLFKVAP